MLMCLKPVPVNAAVFVPRHLDLVDPYLCKCSRTSHRLPPKMSSLGGRSLEVVAYESLDHIKSKFCLISIW